MDEKLKPVPNIVNFGIKAGSCAIIGRNGEYFGLSVQVLDRVLPLYTDYSIVEALNLIQNENIIGCIKYKISDIFILIL